MYVPNRHRGSGRGRHRIAPRIENLEARELLTFTLVHHTSLAAPGTLVALANRAALQATATSVSGSASGSASNSPPSVDLTGTLTPHELRRQTFAGRFKGNYIIGPGRTTAQAMQLSSKGYGGANQSFHLWTDMRITVPKDPTQPITGVIYIISWNVGTTGTQLFLDLVGDRSTEVNGFPTHFTWTVDPTSSGIYGSAGGYGMGHGTVNIQYFRPSPGTAPGIKVGKMNFAINGLIDTSGNFNVIGVLGNIPKNP
jgi:hypothetical protein